MACLDQSSRPPRSAHFTRAVAGMLVFPGGNDFLSPPSDVCTPFIDMHTMDDAECFVVSHLFRIPLNRKRYRRDRIVRLEFAGGVPPSVLFTRRSFELQRDTDDGMLLLAPSVDVMDDLNHSSPQIDTDIDDLRPWILLPYHIHERLDVKALVDRLIHPDGLDPQPFDCVLDFQFNLHCIPLLTQQEGEDDVLLTTLREDDLAVMDLHRRLRFYILRQRVVDFPSSLDGNDGNYAALAVQPRCDGKGEVLV